MGERLFRVCDLQDGEVPVRSGGIPWITGWGAVWERVQDESELVGAVLDTAFTQRPLRDDIIHGICWSECGGREWKGGRCRETVLSGQSGDHGLLLGLDESGGEEGKEERREELHTRRGWQTGGMSMSSGGMGQPDLE